jgi:hypothetical protein
MGKGLKALLFDYHALGGALNSRLDVPSGGRHLSLMTWDDRFWVISNGHKMGTGPHELHNTNVL